MAIFSLYFYASPKWLVSYCCLDQLAHAWTFSDQVLASIRRQSLWDEWRRVSHCSTNWWAFLFVLPFRTMTYWGAGARGIGIALVGFWWHSWVLPFSSVRAYELFEVFHVSCHSCVLQWLWQTSQRRCIRKQQTGKLTCFSSNAFIMQWDEWGNRNYRPMRFNPRIGCSSWFVLGNVFLLLALPITLLYSCSFKHTHRRHRVEFFENGSS